MDIFGQLTERQMRILKKIARLGKLSGSHCAVPIDALLGQGADDHERRRILKLVTLMRGVAESAFLRAGFLNIEFSPAAAGALAGIEAVAPGRGARFCEGVLALKRAIGMRGDAEYNLEFSRERFDHGEDLGHMDDAFPSGCRWYITAFDNPGDWIRRELSICPMSGGRAYATQTLRSTWPGFGFSRQDDLLLATMEEIAAAGEDLLKEARERAREPLKHARAHARHHAGRKAMRIGNMRAALARDGELCRFLQASPEIRESPEWPLGLEPRCLFREASFNLLDFAERFLPGMSGIDAMEIENAVAELRANAWVRRFGPEPIIMDAERGGMAGAMRALEARYPERAAEAESAFRAVLSQGEIRIAWGISTDDFQTATCFAQARISHHLLGEAGIGRLGARISSGFSRDDMGRNLDLAERLFLRMAP